MPAGRHCRFVLRKIGNRRRTLTKTRQNHDLFVTGFVGRHARPFQSHCSLLPRFNQPAANAISALPNFREEIGVAISVENETRGLPFLWSYCIRETDDAVRSEERRVGKE